MKKKARTYVISTLQNKLSIWLESIRKITKDWSREVQGIKPFTFAVPFYDKYTLEKGEDGKLKRVYPRKVKRPDTIEILNEGSSFFILVRKKERVLTAVLAWNGEKKKYQLFLSTGMLARIGGEKSNNKTYWLHLMIRRCLILALRQKSIEEGGFKKNGEDKNAIRIDYLGGLSTYYSLVGIPIQKKEQLHAWCALNILAWKKYLSVMKEKEKNAKEEMVYARGVNALKKLQKFSGRE